MESILSVKKDGCFTIPKAIQRNFAKAGERLIIVQTESAIIIKKMQPVDAVERFEGIAEEIRTQLQTSNVSQTDIDKAIQWTRRQGSA